LPTTDPEDLVPHCLHVSASWHIPLTLADAKRLYGIDDLEVFRAFVEAHPIDAMAAASADVNFKVTLHRQDCTNPE
jgi:hypothetical protein